MEKDVIKRVENIVAQKDTMKHIMKDEQLSKQRENVHVLFMLLKDFSTGRYRKISFSSIIVIVSGLAYLLLPFDMVPDYLPLVGFLDDVAVLASVAFKLANEIESYREWLKGNAKSET